MWEGGDLHNFGRRVTWVESGEGPLLLKPRTTFWEQLLFGSSSEILSWLRSSEPSQTFNYAISKLEAAIFGLQVLNYSQTEGKVRAIVPRPCDEPDLEELHFNAGVLLAYCYVFGIRDLHRGNVKLDGNKLQVLDAEEVFCDMVLPNETLLLPFRDIPLAKCGFSGLLRAGSAQDLGSNSVLRIIEGYVWGIRILDKFADSLRTGLSQLEKKLSTIPIRVILRPTREYIKNSAGPFPHHWLDSEKLQMTRGDVPYFFKFMGSDSVYYYTNRGWDFEKAALSDSLMAASLKVGRTPSELLNHNRIRCRLFAPGIMLLARKLIANRDELSFIGQDDWARITVTQGAIHIASQWGNFQCARTRIL